ncbi:hypothetical protein I203_102384 [Kwoniella mangroviensis CBS 8507]|uniref:uncharacterized protein n=1 Tax=Kwoniella mangroviensis CBS 8507 TaxID=1296122 RepID=UPI00303F8569
MSSYETVTTGRSKRSTAGNRMRELLEKAHQEDDDELFKEVEDDEEFDAPLEVKDVYLEEFADTDEEVEEDEDAEERAIRREERQKAKGKGRAIYDPVSSLNKNRLKPSKPDPTAELLSDPTISLLDPSLDPSSMAPSTLVLAIRKQRREAKREQRSEARRSNLRASTLKTEKEILEKENQQKINRDKCPSRGKRKVVDDGPKTQDELIAAALEEEERNKEALRDWLKKEDEKRELRKIGRKRVKGPRLTWVSRTVGKLVEIIGEESVVKEVDRGKKKDEAGETEVPTKDVTVDGSSAQIQTTPSTSQPQETAKEDLPGISISEAANGSPTDQPGTTESNQPQKETTFDTPTQKNTIESAKSSEQIEKPLDDSLQQTATSNDTSERATHDPKKPIIPVPPISQPTSTVPITEQDESKYTRNYLILSQIPGGLTEEIKLILGDHVEWDEVLYIPSRNRPINRKPPICPFTGLPARYRHPSTSIPYATKEGYNQIEALLAERYKYDVGGWWVGGEEDVCADGMEGVEGWWEAVNGGWLGGREIPEEEVPEQLEEVDIPMNIEFEDVKGKRKRSKDSQSATPVPATKRAKGKGRASVVEETPMILVDDTKKSNSKGKKK